VQIVIAKSLEYVTTNFETCDNQPLVQD